MAAIISIFISLIAFLTPSTAVVTMSPPTGCTTRELLLLSPCLPFISAPPNNLSDTVPSACCEAFSSAYGSRGGICLCYFLREPQILGFPLNRTKLIALSSFCPLSGENGMYLEKNSSLDSVCAASQSLPPLQSSRIPRIQEPESPPADENTPSPDTGLPPSTTVSPSAPAYESPPSPSSATAEHFSLAKDCIGLFFSGSLFLIHFVQFGAVFLYPLYRSVTYPWCRNLGHRVDCHSDGKKVKLFVIGFFLFSHLINRKLCS